LTALRLAKQAKSSNSHPAISGHPGLADKALARQRFFVLSRIAGTSPAKEESHMKPIAFLTIPLLLANHAAFAGSADGNGALALAALVAEHSPGVNAIDKNVLAKFLNGYANVRYAPNKKITLTAGAVTCRASNVDITQHSCDLTFEAKKVATHGRKAHELYATLAEVGVPPDGAAGSIFEAVSNLDCTIDPGEVKQKAGGGAHCTFAPAK
jgi:hypothetical protein